MPQLTEPWADEDAEYEALLNLVLPLAQASYGHAVHRWASLEAKTFGFLALVAAVIGGLATLHDSIHPAWWAPVTGSGVAAIFFIRTLWPRDVSLGPDVVDVHDETRALSPRDGARAVVESLASATDSVEGGYGSKARNFQIGLAILSVSLLGALPVVVFGN